MSKDASKISRDTPGLKSFAAVAFAGLDACTPAPEEEAWRVVPVEPTEAMLQGACDKHTPGKPMSDDRPEECPRFQTRRRIYAAMLEASPVVPVGSGEALRSGLEAAYKAPIGKRWWPELAEDRKAVARILNSPILMQTIADALRAAFPQEAGK